MVDLPEHILCTKPVFRLQANLVQIRFSFQIRFLVLTVHTGCYTVFQTIVDLFLTD